MLAVAAVFLDRDGVIIENRPDYVRSWAQIEILKPALDALIFLSKRPYKIIIVTNQSVVGRQIISHSEADEINNRLVREIENAGGRIDAIYMCPHAPEANCFCRKPKPGLIQQAAGELDVDLAQSIMIGDAVTDIQAGQRAGVGQTSMVLTGRGREQQSLSQSVSIGPFQVYENLFFALDSFTRLSSTD